MGIMSYQSIPAALKDNAKKYGKKTAISYKKGGIYHPSPTRSFMSGS
jgi:long-chain acyl-CoA synthetase